VLRFFLISLASSPPRASISPAVSLQTGKGVTLSLLLSRCAKYVYSDYSGSSAVSPLWRQSLSLPLCSGENVAAAPTSLIVAAFATQRWLLPCFMPHFVAQNSQYGGCSRASRRSQRRQFSQCVNFNVVCNINFI
jgi:hypothetical protein